MRPNRQEPRPIAFSGEVDFRFAVENASNVKLWQTEESAMFLRNYWYVAAHDHEIERRPLGRIILGEPVVFYRLEDGTPVALEDRCAHQGVPLSQGRLEGGVLTVSITVASSMVPRLSITPALSSAPRTNVACTDTPVTPSSPDGCTQISSNAVAR